MRFSVVFLLSLLLLSVLVAFNLYSSYRNNGTLVYPLDDAYIHMAISRNLMENGVWGITRFQFSSTSSSILYTLVLASAFKIAGVSIWVPLVVNLLAAAAILFLTTGIALQYMKPFAAFLLNAAFIVLVPLPGMVMLGMEHTLQIFFCTAFLYLTWKQWNNRKVAPVLYFITGALAVLSRYESAFLLGWTALMWVLIYRNWKQAIGLLLAILVPIIGFGLFAMSKGGLFFPNSLLAKSSFIGGSPFAYATELAKKILANSLVYSLLLLPFLFLLRYPVSGFTNLRQKPGASIMLVTALTVTAHIILANFGWLFRYEAYLIALVFASVAFTWQYWREQAAALSNFQKVVVTGFGLLLLFPILMRIQILSFTNRASKNIADQQVRMAGLVNRYFPSEGIAINDIGAMTYFNKDVHIFDMEGLGTLESLKMRKHLDSSFLSSFANAHQIRLGIFYPHLYAGKVPSTWKQVGSWELTDNFVTGGSVVGFYAIDPALEAPLRKALTEYGPTLPANVISKIY